MSRQNNHQIEVFRQLLEMDVFTSDARSLLHHIYGFLKADQYAGVDMAEALLYVILLATDCPGTRSLISVIGETAATSILGECKDVVYHPNSLEDGQFIQGIFPCTPVSYNINSNHITASIFSGWGALRPLSFETKTNFEFHKELSASRLVNKFTVFDQEHLSEVGRYSNEKDVKDLSKRICLLLQVENNKISVIPVDTWGTVNIQEDVNSPHFINGLILPNQSIFLPDEISEFEDILNSNKSEESDFHAFFNRCPKFLYVLGDYEDLLDEVTLRPQILLQDQHQTDLRPDFLLKRFGIELWDIVELKLPHKTVAVGSRNRRRFSSSVHEAIAQVIKYREFFYDNSNLRWFHERYNVQISMPKLYVIIGRDSSYRSVTEKAKLQSREGIHIFTFDDLHRIAKHREVAFQ